MKLKSKPFWLTLLAVTLINYIAQIPYYVYDYYIPNHTVPAPRVYILLGGTLIWFLIGYVGSLMKRRYGYVTLIAFLSFEALFYVDTFLTGAFIFQLYNPSNVNKAVFIVGYVNGAVAGYYAWVLVQWYRKIYPSRKTK